MTDKTTQPGKPSPQAPILTGGKGAPKADDKPAGGKEATAPAVKPATKPVASGDAAARGPGSALGGLALVVALAAAVGTGWVGYQWWQGRQATIQHDAELDARVAKAIRDAQAQSAQQLAQMQTAVKAVQDDVAAAKSSLTGQFSGQIADVQKKQAADLTALADRVQTLQLGQRGLFDEVEAAKTAAARGDVNALTLSEVGYLLRIANHKLTLEKDPKAALAALSLAEQRLGAANELAFASVQRMLAENVATVRGVRLPDPAALSTRIIELEAKATALRVKPDIQVDNLKARVKPQIENNVPDGEDPWYERLATNAWNQLKDIVVIKHERTQSQPLMTPKESYFLHENLRLNLEAMRVALLRGDAVAFQQSGQLAQGLLKEYFDAADPQVQAMAKELDGLAQTQFQPYLPDLSGTVQAFNEVLARRQPVRSAVGPVTPPPVAPAEAAPAAPEAAPAAEVKP